MAQSSENSQPASLSPIPEWWQASATILGLLAVPYVAKSLLPESFSWAPFSGEPIFDILLFCGFQLLFVSYLVAGLLDPSYKHVTASAKLRPWIVWLGVFCPLIPAVNGALTGITLLRMGHVGYETTLLLCALLVSIFNWSVTFNCLFRGRPASPSLMFMNGVSLVLAASCAAIFAAPESLYSAMRLDWGMAAGVIGAALLSIALNTLAAKPSLKAQAAGQLAVLLSCVFFVLPQISYEFHCVMVQSASQAGDHDARRAAVRVLRAFGSPDELRRGAYGAHRHPSFIEPNRPQRCSEFQAVHYWVTGQSFNDVAPPLDVQLTQALRGDRDLAGKAVGSRIGGVKLATNEVLGWVSPEHAVAHLEWTMSFKNGTDQPQEARAQLLLPAGGVVSRAVLWINGVPMPAAITSTGLARNAYEAVVTGRRDPLLVTWQANDRVMVQCYPVPPRQENTEMKIRLTITAPMQPVDVKNSYLNLPTIVEQNFESGDITASIANGDKKTDISYGAGGKSLQWTHEPGRFDAFNGKFATVPATFYHHLYATQRTVLEQSAAPKNLIFVIDGAAKVGPYRDGMVNALKLVPEGIDTEVMFASDEVSSLSRDRTPRVSDALVELRVAPFVGGPDNSFVLREALRKAEQTPKTAVVWIHGPQPLLTDNGFRTDRCKFYDVHVGGGTNVFSDQLRDGISVQTTDQTFSQDLTRFVSVLCGIKPEYRTYRRLSAAASGPEFPETAATQEVARLAAFETMMRETKLAPWSDNESIAVQSGLVTPLTGAVVLATYEDYINNGIEPPPGAKPTPSPVDTMYAESGASDGGFSGSGDGWSGIQVDPMFSSGSPGGADSFAPMERSVSAAGAPVATAVPAPDRQATRPHLQMATNGTTRGGDEGFYPFRNERRLKKAAPDAKADTFGSAEINRSTAWNPTSAGDDGRTEFPGSAISPAHAGAPRPVPIAAANPQAARTIMYLLFALLLVGAMALTFYTAISLKRKWYQTRVGLITTIVAVVGLLAICSRIATAYGAIGHF